MQKERNQKVEQVLDRLHNDAKNDHLKIAHSSGRSDAPARLPEDYEHAYLPISKEQGESLRKLIITNNCQNIVEFGTSFGISTIYLADAAQQIGGKVISTELLESKAKIAMENIEDAGLGACVEVKIGDAMETLKDHSEPIDLLLLDGWKDLYLPLFQLLEPQFHSKTLIYADNMDMEGTQEYGRYILEKEGYTTQSMDSGRVFLTFTPPAS